MLDALRRRRAGHRRSTAILPPDSEHADRYADAIGDELLAAAVAGAGTIGAGRRGAAHVGRQVGHARRRCAPRSPPISSGRSASGSSRCVADGDRRQRRHHQARPRRLPRVEDPAHRRPARRRVPPRLRRGRARRGRPPGTPVCWMVDPARSAVRRTARTTRWPGAVDGRRRRSRPGTRRAPAHAGCRCLLAACRPSSLAARAAPLRPPSPPRRSADLGPRRPHRRRRPAVRRLSCSGGRWPGSTSTTCGTTALGRSDVFWGVIRAKVDAVRAVLRDVPRARRAQPVHRRPAGADDVPGQRAPVRRALPRGVRASPAPRALRPAPRARADPRALPTTSQWQTWLLFRNSTSFGVADAQFGADVGFYVFELPFLVVRARLAVRAMVLVLLLTLAAHLLNGGVRVRLADADRCGRRRKGHIAVLLAVLAAAQGRRLLADPLRVTNERRGFVQGATYAVVNAQLPALMLLMLDRPAHRRAVPVDDPHRLVAAAARRLGAVARRAARSAGSSTRRSCSRSSCNPNQADREAPYIDRNVDRHAPGDGHSTTSTCEPIAFGTLDARPRSRADLDAAARTCACSTRPRCCRGSAIDRGPRSPGSPSTTSTSTATRSTGSCEQVLIAARELDLGSSPNQSWQGRHLINTRGCGLVMAPASRVTAERPARLPGRRARPGPSCTSARA